MQHKCIKLTNPIWTFLLSPPARGRELKFVKLPGDQGFHGSPPARGRELKSGAAHPSADSKGHPHAGVRIEIVGA